MWAEWQSVKGIAASMTIAAGIIGSL